MYVPHEEPGHVFIVARKISIVRTSFAAAIWVNGYNCFCLLEYSPADINPERVCFAVSVRDVIKDLSRIRSCVTFSLVRNDVKEKFRYSSRDFSRHRAVPASTGLESEISRTLLACRSSYKFAEFTFWTCATDYHLSVL